MLGVGWEATLYADNLSVTQHLGTLYLVALYFFYARRSVRHKLAHVRIYIYGAGGACLVRLHGGIADVVFEHRVGVAEVVYIDSFAFVINELPELAVLRVGVQNIVAVAVHGYRLAAHYRQRKSVLAAHRQSHRCPHR